MGDGVPIRRTVPWTKALLRGQQVLARVKADGTFDAQGGRVEIRYKATDTKAYRAGAANLERVEGAEIMADDAVVAGEAAPSKEERSSARKAEAAKAAMAPGAVPADAWRVFADGACSGNPGPAGLGIHMISPDGKTTHDGFEYLGEATNNVAELTAILRAAELLPPGANAVVHTDSQYSIGVLQKGWKAKANVELVAQLRQVLKTRPAVKLAYVPGHSGVVLNERADVLAREAVEGRKTKRDEYVSKPAAPPDQ